MSDDNSFGAEPPATEESIREEGVRDGVNNAPIAVNDTANTAVDTPVTINVLENDSDPDGDPLTVTSAGSPNGQVTINDDGSLTFTPEAGFEGDALIGYEISDGRGGTDIGKVFVDVPCFTPGTLIATPIGELPVENLKVGDRVITRDNGIQTIRWVGNRKVTSEQLSMAAHLRPVRVRAGALAKGQPERDMIVSPQHRILISGDKPTLYFNESEVLAAAKHLLDMDGVEIAEVSEITYIHIMFDHHEVVLSNGAWTESFQPGDMTLGAMGDAQRLELLELFPDLETDMGQRAYQSARRSLKKHEAQLLTH